MTAPRLLATGLASVGLLTIAGSLAWWWASYGEVYAYDYLSLRQAGFCLVGDSEICRLAASLCRGRHPTFAAIYSPDVLWLGLFAALAGLALRSRAAPSMTSRAGIDDRSGLVEQSRGAVRRE